VKGLALLAALALGQEPLLPVPPGVWFELSFDVGAAVPVGTLAPGVSLASFVPPGFGTAVTGLVHLGPQLAVGAYVRVAGGHLAQAWSAACGGCEGLDGSIGPLVRWSLPAGEGFEAWVAASAGYAGLVSIDSDAFDYDGWDVGGGTGLDYRGWAPLALGVHLSGRWGAYVSSRVMPPFPPLAGPAWHGWIELGFRLGVEL